MIVDGRPSIYEEAYMDDFITGLLVGVFGEELFRKISKNRIAVPLLFVSILVLVELIFIILTLILSISDFYTGKENWVSASSFFSAFIEFHFVMAQPYALLFSAFLALLGTLSYLWHRKYSHPHSDKDSGET